MVCARCIDWTVALLQKVNLFVALKGPTHDGHDHVESALSGGAAGSLVHRELKAISPSLQHRLVMVKDTFTALNHLGAAARTRVSAKVAAITGSVVRPAPRMR